MIKIYKAFHAYDDYIEAFYEKNNHLIEADFQEQLDVLEFDAYPWILSWHPNNTDPEIEIFETVHNAEYLQKSWGNKLNNSDEWQIEIVLKQIEEYQPNICILYPPHLFTKDIVGTIRSLVKHDVLIGGYDGMDRQDIEMYSHFDFVITCSEFISSFYKKHGKETYSLSFGFDPSVLSRIENRKKKYQIGFSGSIFGGVHNDRYDLLKEIQKQNRVDIRSSFGENIDYSLFSKNQLKRLIKRRDVENYLALWRIGKNNFGPVYGLDMFQFLSDSEIILNMHGDKIKFAANVRMFEATGVGSCLLTDYKDNLGEIFEIDKEIVAYKSKEEAVDKIKFLLKNETIRDKIALNGQRRTLEDYSYRKIIPQLISYLKSLLD